MVGHVGSGGSCGRFGTEAAGAKSVVAPGNFLGRPFAGGRAAVEEDIGVRPRIPATGERRGEVKKRVGIVVGEWDSHTRQTIWEGEGIHLLTGRLAACD